VDPLAHARGSVLEMPGRLLLGGRGTKAGTGIYIPPTGPLNWFT